MQSRNERPQYMNHTSTGEPREVAQASHPNLETKVKKAKNSKNLIYSPGNRLVKTQNTLVYSLPPRDQGVGLETQSRNTTRE